MELQVEVELTWHLAGINPQTPFLNIESEGYPRTIQLSKSSIVGPHDKLIVVDMNKRAKSQIRKLGLSPEQCVLVRQEPEVVCPTNYSTTTVSLFGKVIDVGRSHVGSTLSVPCPQIWPKELPSRESIHKRRQSKPVLMNANKLSFIRGELYSLRRLLIHHQEIDLFGPRWKSNFLYRVRTIMGELLICLSAFKLPSSRSLGKWFANHPNYLGLASNKLEIYSNYKVVVAIENSPDYMSEKLLDAIFAGCIPVYVGPPATEFGIPSGLVVQAEANLEAVIEGITVAKEMHYAAWFELATEYLRDEKVRAFWSPEQVLQKVADHVQQA